MKQSMPKFPTMGNIVTKSPWRKVPRRRQPCRTALARENAMPERPFPRDLARIGLEGGSDDDGQGLSGEFHADYDRHRVPRGSMPWRRDHSRKCHDCEYTAGARKGESTSESSTMEQIMPKSPTMEKTVTENPWRKVSRRRQQRLTALTTENAMPGRPFPRVSQLRIHRRSS